MSSGKSSLSYTHTLQAVAASQGRWLTLPPGGCSHNKFGQFNLRTEKKLKLQAALVDWAAMAATLRSSPSFVDAPQH